MTRQYDNYADLITFSRSSGGTALRPVSYGTELVTNGTFDTDLTGWTLSNSPAWVSGRVELSRNGGIDIVRQSFATTIGAVYKVTADVTGTIGKLGIGVSSLDDSILNAGALVNTSVDRLFVATTNTTWIYLITEVNGTSSWDNVSVKEVLFDQGDLTLFNHPAGIPRIEYDADGNRLGLLIEESRTNLVTYSEDFEATGWGSARVSLLENASSAPDGQSTAYLVTEDSTAANTHDVRTPFISLTNGTSYTFSIYAKPSESSPVNVIALRIAYSSTDIAYFNISTGAVVSEGSDATGTIVDAGDGWYRCSVTSSNVDTGSQYSTVFLTDGTNISYSGDGTSGIYIYGAQFEAGSFPTSYIPTSGATATRAADVASIPVSEFGYNQSEGTVFVDINTPLSTGETNYAFALDDGTTTDMAYIYRDASDLLKASTNVSGALQGTLTLKTSALGNNKVAYALSTNDSAAVCTGESVQTDATYNLPTVTDLVIGNRGAGSRELNGHIKSIRYYPRRLTNAQLQELTT